MDIHEAMFSESYHLNEQTARQIFEILPDCGPVVIIADKDGNCWPSDSEKFSSLNIKDTFLKDLFNKIDDGIEPVITQLDNAGIVATQLATERTNCGYVIVVLPQNSPESVLINSDLIEIMLNQIGLIAKLIEKNNLLYELQIKHMTQTQRYSCSSRN